MLKTAFSKVEQLNIAITATQFEVNCLKQLTMENRHAHA
jgi:hypothetical protein